MSAITRALRTTQKAGLKTVLRAHTPVNTVPVRHAFWDKFTGKKDESATTSTPVSSSVNAATSSGASTKASRPEAPIQTVDGMKYKYAVGGNFVEGPNGVKVQIFKAPEPKVVKEKAKSEPKIRAHEYKKLETKARETLTTIPTWTPEELSSIAHDVAVAAANEQSAPKIAEPIFRKPGRFGITKITSSSQKARMARIFTESIAKIAEARNAFLQFIQIPQASTTYTSSPSAPLAFGNNSWLKFKVVTAIMDKSGVTIPSSALGTLNNVNDVVDYVVSRRDGYKTFLETPKTSPFPENVTIVRENTKALFKSQRLALKRSKQN